MFSKCEFYYSRPLFKFWNSSLLCRKIPIDGIKDTYLSYKFFHIASRNISFKVRSKIEMAMRKLIPLVEWKFWKRIESFSVFHFFRYSNCRTFWKIWFMNEFNIHCFPRNRFVSYNLVIDRYMLPICCTLLARHHCWG